MPSARIALLEGAKMIGTHIELILIVTGATTAMALAQFIAPASVSRIIYGAAPTEVVGIADGVGTPSR